MGENKSKAKFNAQLLIIRQGYVDSLPIKKKAIAKAWQHLISQPYDESDAEELKELFHKLAGSGGLYGFPAITGAARNLESFLVQIHSVKQIKPAELARFDELFQELCKTFDGALANWLEQTTGKIA
jgi:HPt (histidine-containing phosphotransfer) domain-containing protein